MSTSTSNTRRQIEIAAEHVYTRVIQCLEGERAVIVVKAPPGSEKTYLLLKVVQALLKTKRRIAVATQTNAQADDVCKRLVAAPWNLQCYRFVGSGRKSETKTTGIIEVDKFDDLPMESGVVVGTSANGVSLRSRIISTCSWLTKRGRCSGHSLFLSVVWLRASY